MNWEQVQATLKNKAQYLADQQTSHVVHLAMLLKRPILLEGPPGVGKTSLAIAVARAFDLNFYRVQCYEGLDENRVLYEWNYSKQILYSQLMREKITEILKGLDFKSAMEKLHEEDKTFFSEQFLIARPILQSLVSDKPAVLLIDEIDRADPEFEAFLLEVLEEQQVSIPEIGQIRAKHPPLVFITSNATRMISEALRRRCLYLYLELPDQERLIDIIKIRVPNVEDILLQQLSRFLKSLQRFQLQKHPSIGEVLDWVHALVALNVQELDQNLVENTLNLILKYKDDYFAIKQALRQNVLQVAPVDDGGRLFD